MRKKNELAQTHEQGKLQHCVYVLYVFNLLFGAHHGRRDGRPLVSLPQLYKRTSCCFIMAGVCV